MFHIFLYIHHEVSTKPAVWGRKCVHTCTCMRDMTPSNPKPKQVKAPVVQGFEALRSLAKEDQM